jgi:hypothetical protein
MISRSIAAALAIAFIAATAAAARKDKAEATAQAATTATPVLNDWFALGSGCRAKSDVPGDVVAEPLAADPARPNVHRVRFHLDSYKLASPMVTEGVGLKFARECAVRVNINPPAGKKIVKVTARTQVAVDKSAPVKLTVASELKLGKQSLAKNLSVTPEGEAVQGRLDDVYLVPGGEGAESFPTLECGEPKIIGFDYTWIAERKAQADGVNVRVGGDRALEIEAELADCN